MSKKNYSKFYNNDVKEPVVEEVVETPVEEATPEVEEVVEEKPVKKQEAAKTVIGCVTDCSKLNIRKSPNINSPALCVIDTGAKLTINEAKSTADWYSVVTPSGVKGYCMRKFVVVK